MYHGVESQTGVSNIIRKRGKTRSRCRCRCRWLRRKYQSVRLRRFVLWRLCKHHGSGRSRLCRGRRLVEQNHFLGGFDVRLVLHYGGCGHLCRVDLLALYS